MKQMEYNVSFSIAAVIIGAILLTILLLNYSSSNLVNKRFKAFLIVSIVMYGMNIITVFTNYHASEFPIWISYLLNGIYFAASNATAAAFLSYVLSIVYLKELKTRIVKILDIVNIALFVIATIALVINGFTGVFFNFEGGQYTHGPAYLFINTVALLFVVESIVLYFARWKYSNSKQKICAALFYALFFGSYIFQVYFFPNIILSDFAVAIGGLIIFFSIETPDYVKLMDTLYELNELKGSLEIQVINRTKELDDEKQSYEELTLETLSSLAEVVDAKDHYTNGHSFRVAAYARALALQLGLSTDECEKIYFAGLIHDVGKIGISETILTKPGKLNPEEFEVIKSHPSLGGNILKGIKHYKVFQEVARSHHERYDGQGYPDKLKGEQIPYAARIVAVCDSFDAMTSDRTYRKALPDEKAIKELLKYRGKQWDANVVDAFIALYNSYPDTIRNHISEFEIETNKSK